MRLHRGTLFAGVVYLVIGVLFFLEGLGAWTLKISDLRYVGPFALLVLGLAVVVGSLGRSEDRG
ncbi:MAG: hypothetical protein WA726_02945 [Acidimicrobiia bacterium]